MNMLPVIWLLLHSSRLVWYFFLLKEDFTEIFAFLKNIIFKKSETEYDQTYK